MSDPLLSPHDEALVDAIAHRVLELLAEQDAAPGRSRLVSAGELAEDLGVSRDWVYRHATELGAERIGGDGPRAEHGGRRLRFDRDKAIAVATACISGGGSQTPDSPAPAERPGDRRRRPAGSEVPPLPVKGQAPRAR